MITTHRAATVDLTLPGDAGTSDARPAAGTDGPADWRPLAVLGVGALATALLVGFQLLDVGGMAAGWELAHWNVAALSAAIAGFIATGQTTGLVRRVRIASATSLALWSLSNVVFAVLVALDAASGPSIADVLAVGFLVPGAWALVASVRDRLSRAEEAAVYLDDALMFLAIAAIFTAAAGEAAVLANGPVALVMVWFPALFLGAGAIALVSLLAERSPLRDGAAAATGIGALLIGIAYIGWALPMAVSAETDSPLDVLFSVGALVSGYGAITWTARVDTGHAARPRGRAIGWAVAPAALVVTMLGASVFAPGDPLVHALLQVFVSLAVAMLVVRFALHLKERGSMVNELERIKAENEALIGRLQAELQERERTQQRLVEASRMTAVGELAAAIAHEVNNPLTSVLGYADLLVGGMDDDDPRRADVEVIRGEAIRVRDRLRSLLEFAAPRRTVFVGADLAAVVAAPLELLRYDLQRRGVALELRAHQMPQVTTDPSAIQQVLINLVTALAGAMPGGGRITVTTGPSGDRAAIVVEPDRLATDLAQVISRLAPAFGAGAGATGDGPDRLNASLGLLRGHGATIGIRPGDSGRPQIEIALPFLMTAGS